VGKRNKKPKLEDRVKPISREIILEEESGKAGALVRPHPKGLSAGRGRGKCSFDGDQGAGKDRGRGSGRKICSLG